MKKTMIFAAAAAMFMFASCQKEEVTPVQDSQSEELVFTATIDQSATKTTINTDGTSADKGKVSWEVNDSISVTDGANTAVYYIKEASDIAADGSATFTYKSGDKPSSTASSYTATYGNAITTAQTYSATAGKLPMTGTSDSGNKTKLNFTVTCGLLKLNLTASGETTKDISRIEIVGRLTGAAKDTLFALTCNNESIESAKDFYIALPAGSYNLMKFTNSKGCVCFKKATTAMEIEANKIQPVTLSGITFVLLPGKFTVASGKQVQFTAANLYWDGSDYAFEAAQTDYPTSWNVNHVGHFFWTQDAANSYTEDYTNPVESISDKFFADGSDADHMLTVDGQSGLYALSSTEWDYLINSRTSGLYKYGVTVTEGGKDYTNCLIIAPDDYSGTELSLITDWSLSNINNLGLVCLPAGGYRSYFKSAVAFTGAGSYGRCWAATPKADNEAMALMMNFDDGGAYAEFSEGRYKGFSIRLVYSEAPSAPTTGTAMAHINGIDVEVPWVQLWADGPKFAVKNVGASVNTDIGSAMIFSDATKTGANYVWGSNWKTPTKDEMDLLNTSKVSCTYCQESGVYGFKFTGVQGVYTGNSLFLPADDGESEAGGANYWSSTAAGNNAWFLSLYYCGQNDSDWNQDIQSSQYYVRPVLSN